MDLASVLIGVGIGALLGGVLVWAYVRERLRRLAKIEFELSQQEARLETVRAEREELTTRLARVEVERDAEQRHSAERLALLTDAQAKLSDAFKALSAEALRTNNQSF